MRLVVSEIYIPCSEGRCVVTALKHERAQLPRLRVLVHSRHTAPEDLEWALAAGGDAVVGKPTASDVLLREVRRLDGLHAA
jgi:DNA-binding NarL/FixJ family response regulator